MTDRPYATLSDAALADEIAVCRECIQTTRDLKLRRQMQQKLAELLGEQGQREWLEGLPF